MALTDSGMRDGAFTLVLDTSSIPEEIRYVFEMAERNAFFQAAYERCMSGQINTTRDWVRSRESDAYIMNGFPEAMKAIAEGNSLVTYDLARYDAQEIERLVVEGRNRTMEEWQTAATRI